MEADGALLAELTAVLAAQPRFGAGVEVVAEASVRGYDTDLTRVHARGAGGEMRLWVKRYRRQRPHARKEWLYLQARAPHGGWDLVEGIAFLHAAAAVVTRHVDGEMLARRFGGPFTAAAVERDCAAAGAWLAAFHRPLPSGAPHPREAVLGDVAARASATMGGRGDVAAAIEALAERLLASASDADLVRVRTHGDFAPFNIVVGERESAVIDPSFEASVDRLGSHCARYEDVARFLVSLQREDALRRAGTTRAAMDAFIDGYRSVTGASLHPGALAAFLVKYALQALLDVWWAPGPGGVPERVREAVELAEELVG